MGEFEEMMCVMYASVTKGHSGDGCDLASTLCKHDLRNCDLFVELGKGSTGEAGKNLFGVDVWWKCEQYFVIASCG